MNVKWITLSGEIKKQNAEECTKNFASIMMQADSWFAVSNADCIITKRDNQSETLQFVLNAIKGKRAGFVRGIFYDSNFQLSEKLEKEFNDILLVIDIGMGIEDVKKILSQLKGKKVIVIYLEGENK